MSAAAVKVKAADIAIENLAGALQQAIEQGTVGQWVRGWAIQSPQNAVSGRPFTGFNPIRCALHNAIHNLEGSRFITVNQAKSAGGRIKHEEWGNYCILVRPNIKKIVDPDTGEERSQIVGWLYYKAWNTVQCENLNEDKLTALVEVDGADTVWDIEDFISKAGANVQHADTESAYYVPSLDYINVPPKESFKDTESYYATLSHEVAHWTGHESRCNRFKNDEGYSDCYAREELVAELAGFAIAYIHGVYASEENAVAYLAAWAERIKDETSNAVITACANAQKAVRYLVESQED